MFQVGQTVVHPGEGLCEVTDVRTEEFVKGQPQEYYLLRPLGKEAGMTVYLPVNQQKVRLRTAMTAAEARALPAAAAATASVWSDNERERQERFAQILRDSEPVAMMRMVQELRDEQARRRNDGKKLRFTDERALQEAVRLLRQELTAVLGVAENEVNV